MKTLLRTALILLPLAVIAPQAWSDLGEPLVGAAAVEVPHTSDLQAEGRLAHERNLPIVLMFSAENCGYCTMLKRDFLQPMIYSGAYQDKALFRVIQLGYGKSVRDFDGSMIDSNDLALRYKVKVTPTLVFVDGAGRPMAPKMVGMSTPDFYGAYLDEAITTAYYHVRGGSTFACKEAHTKLTC